MADLINVETAVVALVAQALYPNGTGQPSVVSGATCRVFPGWPTAKALQTDLAANTVNISVFPSDVERNTTRYQPVWQTLSIPAATLTATVSGDTVTIGGAVGGVQNVAIFVNGQSYVYTAQATDTLTGIATALATLIAEDLSSTTNSGAVITVPAAYSLSTTIGTTAAVIREVKRQKRQFNVMIWCSSPTQRDAVASAIDPVMAATPWIGLADGTKGRLVYERTYSDDGQQKERSFRRWLVYSVEYATTQTQTAPTVVATETVLTGGSSQSSINITQ